MSVVSLSIQSAALAGLKTVYVYVPPGYAESAEEYPSVYLLRGHEREWLNPTEDEHRGGRTAAHIADDLIEQRLIAPLILVMPGLASTDNAVPGLGINMAAPERAPEVGPGRFEDYMVNEVIPAVDAAFRTRADGSCRGIDGFSLGGFSAVSLALRFPSLFTSVGAFDGTFLYTGGTKPDGSVDGLAAHPMLAPVFGDPVRWDHFRRNNPADLLDSLPQAELERLSFHIHSGPQSAEPQSNYYRTQHILQKLADRGVKNSFAAVELAGSNHNWYWADEHLKQTLPRHVSVFAR